MTMSVIVLFFLPWFQTEKIYPVTHPQRWIGYIATILLLLSLFTAYSLFSSILLLSTTCKGVESKKEELKHFPAGYIDSPYIVPDGSLLYFIHSVS